VPSAPFPFRLACLFALAVGPALAAPAAAEALASARQLIASSRLPEAREPLAAALAREPDNVELRVLLADVLGRLHRGEEAVALLEPAMEAHPEDATLVGAYGAQLLLRADELGSGLRALLYARRGRAALERAVALAPRSIKLREGLITFYRQAPSFAGGDRDKARAHAAALVKIDPVRGAVCEASLSIDEQRYPEALAACDAALASAPDDYAALFLLGRTAAESGLRLADGEAALRRCLTLAPTTGEPDRAGVFHRLGMIAEKHGDRAAALAAYQNALAARPAFTAPAQAIARLRTTRDGALTPSP
jgi:tetratricopeptide (TPR) repeat protein